MVALFSEVNQLSFMLPKVTDVGQLEVNVNDIHVYGT